MATRSSGEEGALLINIIRTPGREGGSGGLQSMLLCHLQVGVQGSLVEICLEIHEAGTATLELTKVSLHSNDTAARLDAANDVTATPSPNNQNSGARRTED